MKPARVLLLVAAFAPLAALVVWQAARMYWLCDDAYISFRYARNFIEGRGLVFNPGERVEGYTNFLWVLELSGLWKLFAVRPEIGCTILSSIYTAGTLALTLVLAWSGPHRERRAFVAWGAVLLLAASHTFAVWGTSGLETRQFTFFVLLVVVCLRAWRERSSLLVLSSLALAAGELTRPEANLFFVCCLAWLALERARARDLLTFAAPFAALVGAHFLWRWSYYGDLWPNTYYAKHVRAWPEAGFQYVLAATIEMGLFALVPAAIAGLLARLRAGDRTHLLALAILVPHAAYVVWIGGDHFEYRVMDLYWPLLAVAGLEGIVALSRRSVPALAMLAVLLVCTTTVQQAKEAAVSGLSTREATHRLAVKIERDRFPVLCAIPGVTPVLDLYNRASAYLAQHGIAAPHVEHKVFWLELERQFSPYEVLHGTGWIPADSVTWSDSIGVSSFYLADLVVIDNHGLTDRYIARQPVQRPNEHRYMAHDRSADWSYLERRGFNLLVHPAARSAEEALAGANYAMRIRDDLWMPFDSFVAGWAEKAFSKGPEVRAWRVAQAVGCFADPGLAGWTTKGEAFAGGPVEDRERRLRNHPYRRCSAGRLLDSRGASPGRSATGLARSPVFRVPPGAELEFQFGGRGEHVGVRLLDGDTVLADWHPGDPNGVTPERHRLQEWAGKDLELCVYDESGEAGGYVVLGDAVVLVPALLDRG